MQHELVEKLVSMDRIQSLHSLLSAQQLQVEGITSTAALEHLSTHPSNSLFVKLEFPEAYILVTFGCIFKITRKNTTPQLEFLFYRFHNPTSVNKHTLVP